MLVLHVHDRWSARGGADWHLLSLLDRWPDGVQAAGLYGRADQSAEEGLPPGGLAARWPRHFLKKLDKKASFADEKAVGEKLYRLVKDLQPDRIHVHNILNPHLLAVLADLGPAVMTVQDHRFFCPGRGKVRADGSLCDRVFGPECTGCFREEDYFRRLFELVQARLAALKRFSSLIVLSRYMKGELEAAGIPGERIHVLPPFVHGLAPPTTVASSGGYILFSGRLVWAKGIFDFLDALARLPDRIPAVVAGGGTVDTQVAERTRALGLGHRVRFLGWTAHRGMADVLAGARVVVMPSRWQEPFGIAGLEALAAGRPVAAYEGGGIGDWLENGRTGRIAPSGNSALLAEAILELWDRPDQADAYGQAGRILTAGRFDPGRLMARLEDVYKGMSRNSSR